MPHPLYLDCEFNGHQGHFISIALYDPVNNKNFYEVDNLWEATIKYNEDCGGLKTWVRENVIPMLAKKAVKTSIIRANLTNYLYEFDDLIIYADWPDDFTHLMQLLCFMGVNDIPGKIIPNLKFELITTPDIHVSKLPHNALEDAKALYLNHMEALKNVQPTG